MIMAEMTEEAVNFSVSMEEKSFWQNPDMYNTVSNPRLDFVVDLSY